MRRALPIAFPAAVSVAVLLAAGCNEDVSYIHEPNPVRIACTTWTAASGEIGVRATNGGMFRIKDVTTNVPNMSVSWVGTPEEGGWLKLVFMQQNSRSFEMPSSAEITVEIGGMMGPDATLVIPCECGLEGDRDEEKAAEEEGGSSDGDAGSGEY